MGIGGIDMGGGPRWTPPEVKAPTVTIKPPEVNIPEERWKLPTSDQLPQFVEGPRIDMRTPSQIRAMLPPDETPPPTESDIPSGLSEEEADSIRAKWGLPRKIKGKGTFGSQMLGTGQEDYSQRGNTLGAQGITG